MTSRTWKDNATEWVALGKQGKNVRLALLVACSVRREAMSTAGGKATVPEFAEAVGTTPARILRHLDAWDAAARKRLCPPSNGLFPDDAARVSVQVPSEEEFSSVYDASKSGGRPRASLGEISARIDIDEAYAKSLLDSIAAAHPGLVRSSGEGHVEDGASRSGERDRSGKSHAKPTNQQRADRLPERIRLLQTSIESIIADIRAVKASPYAPTGAVAEQSLERLLSQALDLIASQKDAA